MISHIPAAPNPFPPKLVIYNYDNTIFTFFKDFSTLLDRNHFADKYAVAEKIQAELFANFTEFMEEKVPATFLIYYSSSSSTTRLPFKSPRGKQRSC